MPDQPTPTPAPKNVDEALLMLQADPPRLVKDQAGQVGNQKTKYADLIQANAIILPRLTELGLLWTTAPTTRLIAGPNGQQDPRFVLDWELLHVPSDTKREGSYPLPGGANPMQNGSAITYARRYALLAVTNTVAEDDDDDGAGYRGRQGMAQRANVRQAQTAPAAAGTAQRAAPAPRAERARPEQRPELPAPAGAPAAPADGGERLITAPMTRKLAITMKEVIGNNADDRKAFIIDMVGRPVASSKELTFDEGRHLIDAFEKAKATDNPIGSVIDIYRRTTGGDPAPAPAAARGKGKPAGARQSRTASEALGIGTGEHLGPDTAGREPWEPGHGEPPPPDELPLPEPPDDPWNATATPGGGR